MPTCQECQKYFYDPLTWERELEGEEGTPVERWAGSPLPCHQCPKIPRGKEPKPENAVELDPKCITIYNYELLLREDVTHIFPRDSITVTHAAIIRDTERHLDDTRQHGILLGITRLNNSIQVASKRK